MSEEEKKEKHYKIKTKLPFMLAILSCLCFILALLPPLPYSPAYELMCGSNLISLRRAMIIYALDYEGMLPTPSKWCDLLIEGGYANKKDFKCPSAKNGPCNYAMNQYVENIGSITTPNAPHNGLVLLPDVVLLFETYPGWNQVGSSEILTTANHEDRGCNVSFLDSHLTDVTFVMKQDLQKLKWKPDEAQKE
jgi:hypothetical protein